MNGLGGEDCKVNVFFSYSCVDRLLLDELLEHIYPLKREGVVHTWHHRNIGAGEDRQKKIGTYLESANLIILLVSPSFIASDYCWSVEMNRALERHCSREAWVVPVIIRSCDWAKAPFSDLVVLPRDGKSVASRPDRDEAWLSVVLELRKVLNKLPRLHSFKYPQLEHLKAQCHGRAVGRLSEQLKFLYKRRDELVATGKDLQGIDQEILRVRCLQRCKSQPPQGEFLGNGRYELLELVSERGIATVWKALDRRERHLVTVKIFHALYDEDYTWRGGSFTMLGI